MENPKLRELEPLPAGEEGYYLRDPRGFSQNVLLVPQGALLVLALLDGSRSMSDVQAEFARKTGEILYEHVLNDMLHTLDEALFLLFELFGEDRHSLLESL